MNLDLAEKLKVLGLPSALSKARLRTLIKQILKECHPDASGGIFQDEEQEIKYRTAVETLEIINAPAKSSSSGTELLLFAEDQNALVQNHISLMRAIDEKQRHIQILEAKLTTQDAESKATSEIARGVKQAYAPLMIGGWSVAVIAAGIELLDKPFGGLVEEVFAGNPAAVHYVRVALGVVSIAGLAMGFYARQRSTREIDRLKSIMTDGGLQYLFYRFGYFIFEDDDTEGDKIFSRSSLTSAIVQYTKILDRPTCEATSEAIISKLLERGFATQAATKSLSPRYLIKKELLEDLHYSVSWDFERQRLHERVWKRIRRLRLKFHKRHPSPPE